MHTKISVLQRVCSLLVALAMLLGMTPTAFAESEGENLLQDGGFETDIWADESPWECSASDWGENQTTVSWSEGSAHTGSHSVNWWSAIGATVTLQQEVALEPGTYTMMASVQGESTNIQLFCGEQSQECTPLSSTTD